MFFRLHKGIRFGLGTLPVPVLAKSRFCLPPNSFVWVVALTGSLCPYAALSGCRLQLAPGLGFGCNSSAPCALAQPWRGGGWEFGAFMLGLMEIRGSFRWSRAV